MTIGKRPQRDLQRDVLKNLGATIRAYRHGRRLTREELARCIDFSVAYVILIERGRRNPPYTTVVAIARALGVSASDLFPEDSHEGRPARGHGRITHRHRAAGAPPSA